MPTTPTLIDDLASLVAFETVSDRTTDPMVAWVAQRLEDLGFRVERLPGHTSGKSNLFASIGPPGTDGLVLSGHLDVVPTEGQPWTSDPFVLSEVGDRLVGRGTADMKGFLAAVLHAVQTWNPRDYNRELALLWTYDEEVGCLGAAHLVDHWDLEARPLPRACVIGEPTDFHILRMHSGHVAVHIDIEGRAAHTSKPHLGSNAISLAARVIEVADGLADDLTREHADLPVAQPWVPLSVTRIDGGTAINVVPDACRIQLGYRPLPGQSPTAVFERLRDRLSRALGADMGRVRTHLGTVTPGMLTPSGTPVAAHLHDHAMHGVEDAPFATDGGQLARLGLQPLIFGPGAIDVAHRADEYVPTAALHRTVPILRGLIQARCIDEAEG